MRHDVRNRVLPGDTPHGYEYRMNERTSFTAVTYNVLAQEYVFPDRYPLSPPEALEADGRRARLLQRILALGADLLCLQECEHGVFDALRTTLGGAFTSMLTLKIGKPEGCAIFARRSVLTLEGHETLHYRATSGHHAPLAKLAFFQFDGAPLTVANTHLTFQPDSTPNHLGLAQLRELLARRAALPAATWLLAGDFNALSTSAVLNAAYEAGFDESCRTQRPWDTCNINGRCRKIDYLLPTAGHLLAEPLPLPQLTKHTPMPSLVEPSDHLPLAVRFSRR